MPRQTTAQKETTSKIIAKHKTSSSDTGSPEVQVAIFTNRINQLTEHLKKFKKDFSTQRGLLKLVGQRRRALDYLRSTDFTRYSKLIQSLELRK